MTTFGAGTFGSGTFGNPSPGPTASLTLGGSSSFGLTAQKQQTAAVRMTGGSGLQIAKTTVGHAVSLQMAGAGAFALAAEVYSIVVSATGSWAAGSSLSLATVRHTSAAASWAGSSNLKITRWYDGGTRLDLTGSGSFRLAWNVFTPAINLTGTGTMAPIRLGTTHLASAFWAGGSDADIFVVRPRTVDPQTGREPYRLVIVDLQGNRYAEIDNAVFDGPISWVLNDYGLLSFSLAASDPKVDEVIPVEREVQVWRGSQLIWWGVLIKARGDDKTVNFQAASLEWYFTRRVVGRVPKQNLLANGDFSQGEMHWNFGYDPGSQPAVAPKHSVARDRVLSGRTALRLTSVAGSTTTEETGSETISADVNFAFDSDQLTAAGRTAVDSFASKVPSGATVALVGHTDSIGSETYNLDLSQRRANTVRSRILTTRPDLSVTARGVGESQPIATNSTDAGRAQNRRVEMSYSRTTTTTVEPVGHKQYAFQAVTYPMTKSGYAKHVFTLVGWVFIESFNGPSHDGWGLRLEAQPIAGGGPPVYAYVSLNEHTPTGRWVRMECSLEVPADGRQYRVRVYLYPPSGTAVWDEVGLYHEDQEGFLNVDQALIVKGLVEHAQDPAMGKSDLRIGTRTPLTGVRRERTYIHSERLPISEALSEFPTLADGLDLGIEFTPTERTLATYYPRQGRTASTPLVLGSNIATFSLDVDAEQTSTQVIVQAEGEGADREEGVAYDRSLLNGLVLEKVYNATPGSAVSSLQAQAKRGLGRYHLPVRIPAITSTPEAADELLDRVHVGDLVPVDIRKGWVQEQGTYRVTKIDLDPHTEQITYTIQPWDQWSV